MMQTPICDFIDKYAVSGALRLHMPGHKGAPLTGVEKYDITEIDGADSLYEASGIIRESEKNASALFGCETLYSTEGSSQCIRAMLYLATLHAKATGRKNIVAAGRNAHKTFLSAVALLDIDVKWLCSSQDGSYLSCKIMPDALENMFESAEEKPVAVYITSPDYLGNITDIAALSHVCRKHNALLIVDNAHGAYLKFLPESQHPIDLGADMCCDSAHKTLPALTGAAYLHIAPDVPKMLFECARTAMAMFGSTSPSYLIMRSLDAVNRYISEGYAVKLFDMASKVAELRQRLMQRGFFFTGDESMKLAFDAKRSGYMGRELADRLFENGIVCEFSDPDYMVLMFTPETGEEGIARLEAVLNGIEIKPAMTDMLPFMKLPQKAMSVREAAFSVWEEIPAEDSCGRVLASANVGCPPAVPIVVCGEIIDGNAVKAFRYYGIEKCLVVKEVNV